MFTRIRYEMEIDYLRAEQSQHGDASNWRMPAYVPKRVRMLETVRPDFLFPSENSNLVCGYGQEYEVQSNRWGAVSAVVGGDRLGLRPTEFETIEWCPNPHVEYVNGSR